jgi:hypothetical protein
MVERAEQAETDAVCDVPTVDQVLLAQPKEISAVLQPEVDRLTELGKDPANPV